MNTKNLTQLATAFRSGLENAISDKALTTIAQGTTLLYFPTGCCGLVSDLLAQYLLDHGINTYCVQGEYDFDDYENRFPHTWLETDDGCIIDITADQFSHNPVFRNYHLTPCYVGKHNSFYDLFNEGIRSDGKFTGLRSFNSLYSNKVLSLYSIIFQYIPDSD